VSRSHLQPFFAFTITWLAVVAVACSSRVLLGTDVTVIETLSWLVMACVPPAIASSYLRGRPGQVAAVAARRPKHRAITTARGHRGRSDA